MEKDNRRSEPRRLVGLGAAVAAVFGLAALMVLRNYDPAVIGVVVTTTGLTAAELVSRLRVSSRVADHNERGPSS